MFKKNDDLTIGTELELQLINLHTFDLAMESEDFLRRLSKVVYQGEIKREITQSMIEINSSIHHSYDSLLMELNEIRNIIISEAQKAHIGICGGGTHPFQKWKEQRISQTERFAQLSDQYGYLAKQFTIFGQHIHIGCQNGDDALYLCHAMAQYIPHFVALSACSPFSQGVDTSFDCSRLTIVNAFPLSGVLPWKLRWKSFQKYYQKMIRLGVINNMKDFYWDIRPKPEYGTIEIRVCDTPLSIKKAASLAAFAQLLIYQLLKERPKISKDLYITYHINRFRAARYGLDAIIIDPVRETHIKISEDLVQLCEKLDAYTNLFKSHEALVHISNIATSRSNGATKLRHQHARSQNLSDVVRTQIQIWADSYSV